MYIGVKFAQVAERHDEGLFDNAGHTFLVGGESGRDARNHEAVFYFAVFKQPPGAGFD